MRGGGSERMGARGSTAHIKCKHNITERELTVNSASSLSKQAGAEFRFDGTEQTKQTQC